MKTRSAKAKAHIAEFGRDWTMTEETVRMNRAEARRIIFDGEDEKSYFNLLRRAAHHDGPRFCVYFVRMGNTEAVKVGCSHAGLERVVGLQVASPVPIHMIGYVNFVSPQDMVDGERIAHEICKEQGIGRLRGEWFRMSTAEVVNVAKALILRDKKLVCAAAWKVVKP